MALIFTSSVFPQVHPRDINHHTHREYDTLQLEREELDHEDGHTGRDDWSIS